MDRDRQITLYDACRETATRLRGLLLRLAEEAETAGETQRAAQLRERRFEVMTDLLRIHPEDEHQVRNAMATWGDEIRRRIELPASA